MVPASNPRTWRWIMSPRPAWVHNKILSQKIEWTRVGNVARSRICVWHWWDPAFTLQHQKHRVRTELWRRQGFKSCMETLTWESNLSHWRARWWGWVFCSACIAAVKCFTATVESRNDLSLVGRGQPTAWGFRFFILVLFILLEMESRTLQMLGK